MNGGVKGNIFFILLIDIIGAGGIIAGIAGKVRAA